MITFDLRKATHIMDTYKKIIWDGLDIFFISL